jgi:hypothetical protein
MAPRLDQLIRTEGFTSPAECDFAFRGAPIEVEFQMNLLFGAANALLDAPAGF